MRAGVLTKAEADCRTVHTYRVGQIIAEHPGEVHLGRNDGTTPTVLEVVYVKPAGAALATDAAAPACVGKR